MQYKVDLHTHSIISHDGGIKTEHYKKILEQNILDYIAITDHDDTRLAKELHKQLGEKIIVGEEIKTSDGEIIGLFLNKTIPPGGSAQETIAAIQLQGGLVYIPHPFEKRRKSLQYNNLEKIVKEIDILEVFNGRARWRGRTNEARVFAEKFQLVQAASSDAHCQKGIGSTYSIIQDKLTQRSLRKHLKKATLIKHYAPLLTMLCPAVNKFKNRLILGI